MLYAAVVRALHEGNRVDFDSLAVQFGLDTPDAGDRCVLRDVRHAACPAHHGTCKCGSLRRVWYSDVESLAQLIGRGAVVGMVVVRGALV